MLIALFACRFYLPPIILFAGLSVRKKAFFRNLPTIAAMGIVGTYIAFAIIAGLLAAFAKVISGITLAVRDDAVPSPCMSVTCICYAVISSTWHPVMHLCLGWW